MQKLIFGASALALLGACAPQPQDVVGTYVSPSMYSSYSCKEIVTQRNAVVIKVNELNGAQAKAAQDDATATAVAAVLFWPAMFMVGNNDASPQLAAAKGDYDALTAAGTAKGCF